MLGPASGGPFPGDGGSLLRVKTFKRAAGNDGVLAAGAGLFWGSEAPKRHGGRVLFHHRLRA